jgi:DNA-binding LacI/PurR family transcriptional regulator/serine phosphatase RsbU (regulator of sigma subunit)
MPAHGSRRPRIGLYIRGLSYTYQVRVAQGAHDGCAAHGFDLFCFAGGRLIDRDARNAVYELASAADLDGVIVGASTMGCVQGSSELDALVQRFPDLPVCVIGVEVPGTLSVRIDNESAMYELTRHLLAHGRRRIAFIGAPGPEARARWEAVRRAHREEGREVDPDLVVEGDFEIASGRQAVARWFANGERPCDAIVAANDWMALGALEALQQRGLRVPEDVALTGFDDIDEARFTIPALTTIQQPIRQLGFEATRLIARALRGEDGPRVVHLPTFIEYRRSCGCFEHDAKLELELDLQPFRGTLERHRGEWIQALRSGIPATEGERGVRWARELVDGLIQDLSDRRGENLLGRIDALIQDESGAASPNALHTLLSLLRRECVKQVAADREAWLRAETLFERARLQVARHAERIQGQRRLAQEKLLRVLEDMSADLRMVLDLSALGSALAVHLPKLGIQSCYVAMQTGHITPEVRSRLVMAYEGERGPLPKSFGTRFRCGDLVPPELAPERRCSMVVEPLLFRKDAFGFCSMEMGSQDGATYELVREQISAALMSVQLFQNVLEEANKRERAERAQLASELEIAARIQVSILPRQVSVKGLEIATSMLPATEVGGDYFDILPFEGGCWFGIGDVAGHGLHAGLLMLMIQSIVSGTVRANSAIAPSAVWQVVNGVLHDNIRLRLQQDDYATLALLRYDGEGRFVFSGGHEEIVVYRAAERRCELVPVNGAWVGVTDQFAEPPVCDAELRLSPGDVLVLYTDGVTEAMNGAREPFGLERLCADLERLGSRPVEEIREALLASVKSWMFTQLDDQSLVVVRYAPSRV